MARPTTLTVAKKVSNYDILESDSGTVFTNMGAGSTVILTLPEDASNGVYYFFTVQVGQYLRISPGTGTIRSGRTSGDFEAGKYIQSNTIGELISLISNGVNEWYSISRYPSSWDLEA